MSVLKIDRKFMDIREKSITLSGSYGYMVYKLKMNSSLTLKITNLLTISYPTILRI